MSRDLFGSVTRPCVSIGRRKWCTLPVSLLSHAAIVAALVAILILAPAILPNPWQDSIQAFVTDGPVPTPPPAPRVAEPVTPPPNHDAAPITAPDRIAPEPPRYLDWQDSPGVLQPGLIAGDFEPTVVAPPPPPTRQEPVVIGGTIRRPQKVHDARPVYPAMALAARVEGIVIIEAVLDADGAVANARVLRGVPLLDPAALDAVRQWRFTPTLLNGHPVPVVMSVTVTFRLR